MDATVKALAAIEAHARRAGLYSLCFDFSARPLRTARDAAQILADGHQVVIPPTAGRLVVSGSNAPRELSSSEVERVPTLRGIYGNLPRELVLHVISWPDGTLLLKATPPKCPLSPWVTDLVHDVAELAPGVAESKSREPV